MRVFIRSMALKFSLSGFVRNLDDGRVEAVLQGEKESIGKVLERIREGGAPGQIQDLKLLWEDPFSEFNGFVITHGEK